MKRAVEKSDVSSSFSLTEDIRPARTTDECKHHTAGGCSLIGQSTDPQTACVLWGLVL